MGKVLVVGLDGATFDVIRPLVEAGRLPTLATLLKEGAWGPLKSAIPPITPTAWTSLITGKNPGKYGIYDFKAFDPVTYQTRTIRINEHREKTIWHLLGEANRRSIVVDVPFTFPPMPLEGLMITGYGTPRTPDTVFTYPADLARRVPAALRDEIKVALPLHRFDRSAAFVDEWRQVMAGRRRLLRHLMTEEPWDFFFHVFTITDNLSHIFWTYMEPSHPNYQAAEGEAFREALWDGYAQCDQLLGEMLAWAGPDTQLLVVSDHGFGSVYPRQYLYQRLAAGDFIKYQSPPFLSFLGDKLMRAATRGYTRLPFLREFIKGLRPEQQQLVRKTLQQSRLMPTTDAIDKRKSPLLASGFGLQMWVNEQGRFATGPVPSEEKGALLDRLEAHLLADRDTATGRPIVAQVYRGREVYHGPALAQAPDVIIEYTNFYRPGGTTGAVNANLEGGHTSTGIFLARGSLVKAGQMAEIDLTDLAPTLLYLSGLPVPPDMDGRVLVEMVSSAHVAAHPPRTAAAEARLEVAPIDDGYSPEEAAEVEEQLRQLGYI